MKNVHILTDIVYKVTKTITTNSYLITGQTYIDYSFSRMQFSILLKTILQSYTSSDNDI